MRAAAILLAGALLHTVTTSASRVLRIRQDDGGNGFLGDDDYLMEMCFPNYFSPDSAFAIDTPCEAFYQIETGCVANGTEPLDYLAQQQCVCGAGSGFFDMLSGCNSCFQVHGGVEGEDWFPPSVISSASIAFCTGTPTTDIVNVFDSMTVPTVSMTTASDLFPSQTAVSLYFTGTVETAGGQITGTALQATRTIDDNLPMATSSATGTRPDSSTVTSKAETSSTKTSGSSSPTGTGKSNSTSTASGAKTTTETGNAAAELKAMGSMLAMVADE